MVPALLRLRRLLRLPPRQLYAYANGYSNVYAYTTATFTPTPTATFTPTPTATFTPTPTATFTPTPTATCYANTDADSDTDTTGTVESDHADRNDLFTVRERHGRRPSLNLNYSVSSGKIKNNVTPGVFFYWVSVTVPAGNNSRYDHSNDHDGQLHRQIRLREREQCV